MALAHDDGDLIARKRFMRISLATTDEMRAFWKFVEPNLPAILDGFYQHVASEPHLRAVVGDNTPRLKRAQTNHWQRLFSGNFDAAYYESVRVIGHVHQKIGLKPRWYIGGYAYVLDRLVEIAIRAHRWSPGKMRKVLAAVNAAVMLDMDIAISVYQEALLIEREQRESCGLIVTIGEMVMAESLRHLVELPPRSIRRNRMSTCR